MKNNITLRAAEDRLCTAVGSKIVVGDQIVHLAKSAGYDSIFIDLEQSSMSCAEASRLSATALLVGITPVVRVPYQCGNGLVQRLLDGGAMGIVFPHVSSPDEAEAAVRACKFPPRGKRSFAAALPHFHYQRTDAAEAMQWLDEVASTVIVMIETAEALANVDGIAATPGVDMLFVGATDLAIELGVVGQWEHVKFQTALQDVSAACKRHGKIFGLGGLHSRPDICQVVVKSLGARFILGNVDIGLLSMAMEMNVHQLKEWETAL
ncbi:Pyruvate/Phosphoenolpyruvate kinase [Cordyceps militaris CM01]|uniref:Pyruvate/Phosphoenolpyruvate kinase n=1 Tax=Cordyceps militaris (strain CM01) TaxID=983644 RepID=G3J8V9_CORMM|nr:Pyruvate/Phosphoenolpyruvate kinase [Cordyceps militaris CM01]EGX94842.1 Pyruvate/Phosphoenolpyruvate kinase [Cordyceps militaris CM01]